MRLGFRLLLGYFLIVGLAAFFVLKVFVDEVKPGVRQTMEDTMVDTANLLAEMAVDDLEQGRMNQGRFAQHWAAYRARTFNAHVWGFDKRDPGMRVYITDRQGLVVFDSENKALGQNYRRWNDVHLTLRGEYGVRTTPETAAEGAATVMHVAAPIRAHGQLLGVLTVAKSNLTVEPFIRRSKQKIVQAGGWLVGLSLLIGAAATLWLNGSVRQLVRYAQAVTRGERVALPRLSGREIQQLGAALESMRTRLEGKHYVEHYVTTLTHEMKSPLAAIQGAAELLEEDMPAPQRQRFLGHIREQSQRLRLLIDKMLAQATVEQRQQLDAPSACDLMQLLQQAAQAAEAPAQQRGLQFEFAVAALPPIQGDAFLLRQAIANLIDNAIAFSPSGSRITLQLQAQAGAYRLSVRDHGPGVPDYALPRVFERFYSLPRPDGSGKSTGLGLSFVHEVMQLHGGQVTLQAADGGGTLACLLFPIPPRGPHADR